MPLAKLPLTVLSIHERGGKEYPVSRVPFHGVATIEKRRTQTSSRDSFPNSPRNVIANDIDRPAKDPLLIRSAEYFSCRCCSTQGREKFNCDFADNLKCQFDSMESLFFVRINAQRNDSGHCVINASHEVRRAGTSNKIRSKQRISVAIFLIERMRQSVNRTVSAVGDRNKDLRK